MWCQLVKKRFCTQFSNWFSRITLHYCYWKLCYTRGITHRLLCCSLDFPKYSFSNMNVSFFENIHELHWNIKWSQRLSLIFGRQNWLIYIYILSISYYRSQKMLGIATLFECFFFINQSIGSQYKAYREQRKRCQSQKALILKHEKGM